MLLSRGCVAAAKLVSGWLDGWPASNCSTAYALCEAHGVSQGVPALQDMVLRCVLRAGPGSWRGSGVRMTQRCAYAELQPKVLTGGFADRHVRGRRRLHKHVPRARRRRRRRGCRRQHPARAAGGAPGIRCHACLGDPAARTCVVAVLRRRCRHQQPLRCGRAGHWCASALAQGRPHAGLPAGNEAGAPPRAVLNPNSGACAGARAAGAGARGGVERGAGRPPRAAARGGRPAGRAARAAGRSQPGLCAPERGHAGRHPRRRGRLLRRGAPHAQACVRERGLLGPRCGVGACLPARPAPTRCTPGMSEFACWGCDAVLGHAHWKHHKRPGWAACPDTEAARRARTSALCWAADADYPVRSGVQLHALMAVLERPYTQQPGAERFTRTERKVRMGVELLSCSS
jgi:hypothetical protein